MFDVLSDAPILSAAAVVAAAAAVVGACAANPDADKSDAAALRTSRMIRTAGLLAVTDVGAGGAAAGGWGLITAGDANAAAAAADFKAAGVVG